MKVTKDNAFKLVCELNLMKPDALKNIYFEIFGSVLPSIKNRDAIVERLAYRIQEIAYGGLSTKVRDKLNECLEYQEDLNKPQVSPGAVIRKEYKGNNYEIQVCDDCYIFDNIQYKSLSAIAKKITGTNWNGKVFFNVK